MGIAFEDGDTDDDPLGNLGDEASEPQLVDLDAPEASHAIKRNFWYEIDFVPQDVETDWTNRPVICVTAEDGTRKMKYLIRVCLPPVGREFSSPGVLADVAAIGQEADMRRNERWKIPGGRPYWVKLAVINGEGLGGLQDFNVLDVEFPGGRIPSIDELTRGSPLLPVEKSADMQETPQKLIRRVRQFLRETLGWMLRKA